MTIVALNDELTLTITGLGEFRTTPNEFDAAMAHYLPASSLALRQKINTHPYNPLDGKPYDHLMSVTELLMVLAHFDRLAKEKHEAHH